MRIGEVAERTGLSISNIRFYEKKGLIKPVREEDSKYRDYTEEDIECLKRIILYRKLNMSIEKIQELISNNEPSILSALEEQMEKLNEEKAALQSSIDLCQVMLQDEDFENPDIDYYLSYVKEEEKAGSKYPQLEELLDDFADMSVGFMVEESPIVKIWFSSVRGTMVKRIIALIIFVVWLAFPITMIVDDLLETGAVSAKVLAVMLLWLGVIIYYMVQLITIKNKRNLKK